MATRSWAQALPVMIEAPPLQTRMGGAHEVSGCEALALIRRKTMRQTLHEAPQREAGWRPAPLTRRVYL